MTNDIVGDGKSLVRSIIFEVTARCNERCLHCYNVWRLDDSYPKGELDTAGTEKLLDKIISEARPLNISFTGGEPLLRADIVRLARFVVARDVDVNVLTNGTLLSEELAKELIESGVSLFEIPILGLRDTHNSLAGIDGFDRTVEGIANVKLHRGRVVTVFVITKKNLGDLGEMLKLSFALGADGVMVNRFNPGGEGARHIDELLPTVEELREAFGIVEKLSEEYKLPVSTSIPMPPCIFDASRHERLKFHFCAAGTDNAYFAVDPLGNVRMCNHTSLILGNALDEPFETVVSRGRTEEFLRAAPPSCDGCDHRAACQGGCKASAQVCYGSLCVSDPFLRANARH